MTFLAGIVDVSRREIDVGGFFFVHGMIRLEPRRRRTSGLNRPALIAHFMCIDLARGLAVFHSLLAAIGGVGGSCFIVVQKPHATFGLWLGPLVAATGVGNAIGRGNLHGDDRWQ